MLKPHERHAIFFLLRHLIYGTAGGIAFGTLLLVQDFAGLRSLIWTAETPWLWLLMLFFGLFITFGSIAMGIGIMSLGRDEY